MISSTITADIIFAAAVIPSIVLHEVAHGFVANLCGDPTAKKAGRLTLNPISHVDPVGTIMIPLFMLVVGLPPIGYAKPVPVTVNKLRHPRNQHILVALAGPFTNIALSAVGWVACRFMVTGNYNENSNIFQFFLALGLVNIFLALLNMLPIPPLDGSAVIERLVPVKHLRRYYEIRARALPFAMIILLVLYVTHGWNGVIDNLETWWINTL